jgi:coenzyme PQQ synthesis protein D (PqqD)
MISKNSKVVATKEQVSADLGGEVVILNMKNGVYYGLDPVGARIWSLIQDPTTVKVLRDAIFNEYDVEADRCERDLLVLLQDLASNELIEVKDEAIE